MWLLNHTAIKVNDVVAAAAVDADDDATDVAAAVVAAAAVVTEKKQTMHFFSNLSAKPHNFVPNTPLTQGSPQGCSSVTLVQSPPPKVESSLAA